MRPQNYFLSIFQKRKPPVVVTGEGNFGLTEVCILTETPDITQLSISICLVGNNLFHMTYHSKLLDQQHLLDP